MSQQLANKFGIPLSLLNATNAVLSESDAYQAKVKAHMAKKGIKSLNDMTADQKKNFFNELDSMHTAKNEEVKDKKKMDGEDPCWNTHQMVGMKKGKGGKPVPNCVPKNEEVEEVEEAESAQAKTTMKHIEKPTEGEKKAAKDIKPGVAGYRDRVAMLKSAEARGALKKEEAELTQEDLDFIASLNQDEVAEGQSRNFNPHSDLAIRGKLPSFNKTAAGKKREADRETERLKDKMKFTKSQGGIAGPKGKLPEEVELEEEQFDLEDFTLEQIEEFMQTEDYDQLDELSKETLGSYVKKRSNDVATQGAITRKFAMDAEAKKKEHGAYTSGARELDQKSNKAFEKGWKHRQNMAKAVDKIVKKA